MNIHLNSTLFAAVLCSCSISETQHDPTATLPNYHPVPEAIIEMLPGRIERLPVRKSLNGDEFLERLGLAGYSDNICHSVRFSSYFMVLNKSATLQIRCDPDSLIITKEEVEKLQNSLPPSAAEEALFGTDFEVIGCTLFRDQKGIIAHRWLEDESAEQVAGSHR
ncbi:hypothetical protein JIN85_18120 [Luteolibacter pohnpeiensis]|uniref:Uncharacterized protein n=1 Tax=Luteolibacter pohnpeiensis TaxID=454153 RepID=A0A934SAE1_9BACT|nr:hypothetical protein [Luteolibacter pohnpeiensis]MBK1884340.1 hypothetical protein [Luteolibacter pohnpeiensis]